MAARNVVTKVDTEDKFLRLNVLQALLNELIKLCRHKANDRHRLQVLNRLNAWQGPVTPSLRKQRHIITDRLVPIRSTKIKYLGIALHREVRLSQVTLCRDNFDPRKV